MHMSIENKQSYMLGILTGIGVIVILGGVFMFGRSFGVDGAESTGTTAGAPTAQQPTAPTEPGVDPSKVAAVTDDDHILGNVNAPITMIEYSDFECPFCARFKPTVDQILSDYAGKVRVVYRHFPLRSIHQQAQKAAEASECASDQGKFWEMHDALFNLNLTQSLSLDSMKNAAAEIGLNTSTFNTCLDTGAKTQAVEEDYQNGIAAGVRGTPGSFIGDQYVPGALPFDQVKPLIDSLL